MISAQLTGPGFAGPDLAALHFVAQGLAPAAAVILSAAKDHAV